MSRFLTGHDPAFTLAAMSILRKFLLAALLAAAISTSLAEDEDESSPVDQLMESISRDMKKLSRQFDNAAAKASSLELVDAMIKANTQAKSLEPESVGDRAGAEREAYLARYREGMDELGQCLSSLKAALEIDNTGEAEAFIDKAYALRKKYHGELL